MALRAGEADRQLSAWSLEIRLFLLKTLSKVAKEGNVLNLIKGICVNLQAPPPFTVGDLVPHGQEQGQNVLSHWSCSRRPVLTGAPRQETEQALGSGGRRRTSVRTQDLLCRPCGGVLPEAARTEKRVPRSRRCNAPFSPPESLVLARRQPAARLPALARTSRH